MAARKKLTSLKKMSVTARKAAAVKGGRKQRSGQATLSNSRRDRLSANHNQTLRTSA